MDPDSDALLKFFILGYNTRVVNYLQNNNFDTQI
jgi:hypothetical protein